MQSLRAHLNCLNLTGPRSVLFHFFGLQRAPETLSLRQHMTRVRRPAILHLNIIRVGFDTLAAADREVAERKVDLAVHRTRQIYDQIQLGIARVAHFAIPAADAGGKEDIGGDGEADDLCGQFSAPISGLDAFFVLTYAGNRIGSSRSPGSCSKDGKSSGVIVEIEQAGNELTATVLAHEIGHYLGVSDHPGDPDLLMSHGGGRTITTSQGRKMRSHCLVTDCDLE